MKIPAKIFDYKCLNKLKGLSSHHTTIFVIILGWELIVSYYANVIATPHLCQSH